MARFANPNMICGYCRGLVDGAVSRGLGRTRILEPCGHVAEARSQCVSWGPVDGCTCPGHPHRDSWTESEAS